MDASGHGIFTVAPSNGTNHELNGTGRAYISVFDIMEVSRFPNQDESVWADQCALWFCVQAINISVSDGWENQTVVGNWSQTRLDYPSSAHETEYIFENIPADFNAAAGMQYAVTDDAMTALRNFMNPLMRGTVSSDVSTIDYSSDWIEAIWNATYDLPTWISNLALSMTNEVRVNGQGSGQYEGYGMQTAPLHQRPVALDHLSATLIAASIYYPPQDHFRVIKGRRVRVENWRPCLCSSAVSTAKIHEKVRNGMDVPDGWKSALGRPR